MRGAPINSLSREREREREKALRDPSHTRVDLIRIGIPRLPLTPVYTQTTFCIRKRQCNLCPRPPFSLSRGLRACEYRSEIEFFFSTGAGGGVWMEEAVCVGAVFELLILLGMRVRFGG